MGHTISRKNIKKIITVLTAAVMVLIPIGGSIRQVQAEEEQEINPAISLEHEKTVTENADGTYDLKLTVKGKTDSRVSKTPMDVIYVLDRSNSMEWLMNKNEEGHGEQKGERKIAASQAINNLTNTLAASQELDVRFALVTFSGTNRARDEKAWDDAQTVVNWTGQASDITSKTLPDTTGGTNYQAGLREAGELLKGVRSTAKTAVIFVSDGDPTYRYDRNGMTIGNGNNDDENGARGANLNAAKTEAAKLYTDYFFTVGVGPQSNYKTLTNLASSAANAKNYGSYAGTSLDALNNAFDDIKAQITKLTCTNVRISDPLSENVEMVTDTDGKVLSPQVIVLDASGRQIDAASLGITASYDAVTRSVALNFPAGYALEEDYTYQVVAKIQPSEAAYEKFRTGGYTDIADEGTGTYAGQEGFYSNQNESARLDYVYNENAYTEMYPKPVVHVHPGNLKISKVITGLDDNPEGLQSVKDNLVFTCTLTKPDKTQETKVLKLDADGLTWDTETGAYVYRMINLTPGTSYEVREDNAALEGYDLAAVPDNVSSSGIITRDTTSEVDFQNRYTRSDRFLKIEKKVEGNMGDRTHPFTFHVKTELNGDAYTGSIRYTKYDAQGNALSEEEMKDAVTVENGVYTFQLKHLERIEVTIPYGVEYTVSEDAEDYDVQITGTPESVESGEDTYTAVIHENTDLTFTNTKDIPPATGIRQTGAPYLVMTGSAGGMLALFGVLYGIRRWLDLTEE